jgi:basic membrane lipoprotein Med (substrate-binding protein (PBP1-ABC) superfamily)
MLAALAVVLVGAAACGGDTGSDSGGSGSGSGDEASEDAPRLAILYSAEWRDGSWGEVAYEGARSLEESGEVGDVALQENVPPGAEAQRTLRDLAEEGYSPIVAHSFNYGDDVKAVAPDYPDTLFVYAGGFGDVAGNVGDYAQPFYQASYLEGILAAGVMPDGNVAGAGGFDIPVCRAMYNAFLAGAQEVRPDVTGSFVEVGDWYDVQLANEAANGQADAGATMFVGCGQGPTFGQIETADDRGNVATGYVGDMSARSDAVLSSVVWNLEAVFQLMVDDVAGHDPGEPIEARYYEVSLADDGMSVAINPSREGDIPAEVMDLYEERLAAIEDGSFEVPLVEE